MDISKTILITGGAGFIGSNLCEKLVQNNRIICVDNFCTGSINNIEKFLDNPNFTLIEHDIINPLEIDEKIDEIYNLACPASPKSYQGKNAIFTTKTCVLGSINMLDLANKHNAKILQSSTSEVYGEPLEHPQNEKYRGNVNSIGIRACYDEGKRCAESLFFDYQRNYGTKIKVVRIFNTYGKNMQVDDGRVISNLICQALMGKKLTIYGDGNQTRSFCYVDDLVDILIKVMSSKDDFLGPINIGNPQEFTILELANLIKQKINNDIEIDFMPLPQDDPCKRKPDITLAKSMFNWEPKIKLEEGLDLTIKYFKERLT